MKYKKINVFIMVLLQALVWFSVFSNAKNIILDKGLDIMGVCATVALMICGGVFITVIGIKNMKLER